MSIVLARLGVPGCFIVIEARYPKAVLMNIRKSVKLAAREPKVLKVIGEESERNGTSKLTSREIDRIIKAARLRRAKR
jgi:hypothetical protein